MSSRVAKVEHDGGNDRRAHSGWAHSTEPSETTARASRLTGRGGGKTKSWWDNGRIYFEGVDYTDTDGAEQADRINRFFGTDRRKTPTEQADQRGEAEKKYEVEIKREAGGANDKSRWDTDVVATFAVEG